MCYGLNFFSFLLGKNSHFFSFLFGEKPSSYLLSYFLCELQINLIIKQNTSLVTLPVTKCVWIFPTATSKSTTPSLCPNSILIPSAGSQHPGHREGLSPIRRLSPPPLPVPVTSSAPDLLAVVRRL